MTTAQQIATTAAEIRQIDREIDAVRRTLRSREKVKLLSARSWQTAWDKHPELYEQQRALFWQRGDLQMQRDHLESKIRRATVRMLSPKKCPACRGSGLAT